MDNQLTREEIEYCINMNGHAVSHAQMKRDVAETKRTIPTKYRDDYRVEVHEHLFNGSCDWYLIRK